MLLNYQGRRLYYDLIGPNSGPVVCFAHSLGTDGGMWAEQVPPLLAKGFRVIRLDMRGHGGSDSLPGDYTMDELADDAAAVLEMLGLSSVHFIGLSIGGMFGQALAINHATKFKSMMLCATLTQSSPEVKSTWAPRVAALRKSGSLESVAEGSMQRWLTESFKQNNPARWKQIRDTLLNTSIDGYLGSTAAIQDFDYVPRLPTIKLPTLVVCGADDPGPPPSENRRLASLIPGGRYEEMAGARHFPNVEFPESFNRIMLDWLSQNR